MTMIDTEMVAREISRLHVFFEDWFRGDGSRSISELADSLDVEFFIVSPMGRKSNKASTVEGVRSLRGQRDVAIEIGHVVVERVDDSCVTATYEEHQTVGNQPSTRLSTVGMAIDEVAPGGFRWLFVHETWLIAPDCPQDTPASK